MNTLSNRLSTLTTEFPDDTQAVRRLAEYVDSRRDRSTEVSLSRLYELTSPSSALNLSKIIQRSIELGVFKEIYRVDVTGSFQQRDFSKIGDIPKYLHDIDRNVDVEVQPQDLNLYYSIDN